MGPDKKSGFSPPALGGSSLLVVFAVLSLTVFALLGLSTVRADGRLGEASAKSVAAYYEADCQAQGILAQLRQGVVPKGVQAGPGEGEYTFTCPIDSTQQLLQARVRVDKGGGYTVLSWQAVPAAQWETDDHIEVWEGE